MRREAPSSESAGASRFFSIARSRGVAVASGIVVLYAIAGFFVAPAVARRQIEKLCRDRLGREATVARVTLNPFTLAGVVEGFEMKDRDGAPLVRVERLGANLQVSGLFRWAWTFREIGIEGPAVLARLLADGSPSVADWFAPRPAAEAGDARGVPRVLVHRFKLTGGRIDFLDESRTPVWKT
jgi:hypothetical protein